MFGIQHRDVDAGQRLQRVQKRHASPCTASLRLHGLIDFGLTEVATSGDEAVTQERNGDVVLVQRLQRATHERPLLLRLTQAGSRLAEKVVLYEVGLRGLQPSIVQGLEHLVGIHVAGNP